MMQNTNVPSQSQIDEQNDAYEIENQFVLRLPRQDADKLNALLRDSPSLVKSQLSIKLDDAFRTAVVVLGDRRFNARLMNLPCIVEALKTHDNKSFYKVTDLSQILICSPDDFDESKFGAEPLALPMRNEDLVTKVINGVVSETGKRNEDDYPHGLTPPMRNVRRSAFRKSTPRTKLEPAEVEDAVRRLLRDDLAADSVKWSVSQPSDTDFLTSFMTPATAPDSNSAGKPSTSVPTPSQVDRSSATDEVTALVANRKMQRKETGKPGKNGTNSTVKRKSKPKAPKLAGAPMTSKPSSQPDPAMF